MTSSLSLHGFFRHDASAVCSLNGTLTLGGFDSFRDQQTAVPLPVPVLRYGLQSEVAGRMTGSGHVHVVGTDSEFSRHHIIHAHSPCSMNISLSIDNAIVHTFLSGHVDRQTLSLNRLAVLERGKLLLYNRTVMNVTALSIETEGSLETIAGIPMPESCDDIDNDNGNGGSTAAGKEKL
jgi:hypothetical protein